MNGANRRTSTDAVQWVEESNQQVHEHGQVEGDAAPERHVSGAPVQNRLGWREEPHGFHTLDRNDAPFPKTDNLITVQTGNTLIATHRKL